MTISFAAIAYLFLLALILYVARVNFLQTTKAWAEECRKCGLTPPAQVNIYSGIALLVDLANAAGFVVALAIEGAIETWSLEMIPFLLATWSLVYAGALYMDTLAIARRSYDACLKAKQHRRNARRIMPDAEAAL